MSVDTLSSTFFALADPTRRAILLRLSRGETSVKELIRPLRITGPAVTKHLKILERSGLITRSRHAQWRPCKIEAAPLKEVATCGRTTIAPIGKAVSTAWMTICARCKSKAPPRVNPPLSVQCHSLKPNLKQNEPTPYIHFDGNCQEALDYYSQHLGAKVAFKMTYGDMPPQPAGAPAASAGCGPDPGFANKIMHARVNIGEGVVMASDCPPGRYTKPEGFFISLDAKDTTDAKRLYDALSAEGRNLHAAGRNILGQGICHVLRSVWNSLDDQLREGAVLMVAPAAPELVSSASSMRLAHLFGARGPIALKL